MLEEVPSFTFLLDYRRLGSSNHEATSTWKSNDNRLLLAGYSGKSVDGMDWLGWLYGSGGVSMSFDFRVVVIIV